MNSNLRDCGPVSQLDEGQTFAEFASTLWSVTGLKSVNNSQSVNRLFIAAHGYVSCLRSALRRGMLMRFLPRGEKPSVTCESLQF